MKSEGYWKLIRFDRRFKFEKRSRALFGKPPLESVVQDVQIPMEHAGEFWKFFLKNVPIRPVWFCPTRSKTSALFPLAQLDANKTYINFGFWNHIPAKPGQDPHYYNFLIEDEVAKLHGTKGLYAEAFYDEPAF